MRELNIYGDVSWGWVFDKMDRYAHNICIRTLWACVTASGFINYFSKLEKDEPFTMNHNEVGSNENKRVIHVTLVWDDWRTVATASFLFIKRK